MNVARREYEFAVEMIDREEYRVAFGVMVLHSIGRAEARGLRYWCRAMKSRISALKRSTWTR
jgi:hypothetical protein